MFELVCPRRWFWAAAGTIIPATAAMPGRSLDPDRAWRPARGLLASRRCPTRSSGQRSAFRDERNIPFRPDWEWSSP